MPELRHELHRRRHYGSLLEVALLVQLAEGDVLGRWRCGQPRARLRLPRRLVLFVRVRLLDVFPANRPRVGQPRRRGIDAVTLLGVDGDTGTTSQITAAVARVLQSRGQCCASVARRCRRTLAFCRYYRFREGRLLPAVDEGLC